MNTNLFRIAVTVGAGWMLLLTAPAFAAPGDLDPTFGTGGRVIVDHPTYYEEASSIAQQGEKLLVGRNVVNFPSGDDFSVVRLNANGSHDRTFSGDGTATADLPGTLRGITYVAVPLVNGKILAAGYISNENGLEARYGLVRYLDNGSIDPTFGSAGLVAGTFAPTQRWIRTLIEQPDGRLVVAGGAVDGEAEADMWIGRLNTDGSFDSSFGNAGTYRVDFFGADGRDAVQALALQIDGSIVAAGYAVDANGARNLVMLRLTAAGARDSTFGVGGIVAIPAPGDTPWANVGMNQLGDGKFVIAGQSRDVNLEECEMRVARFTHDGQPDAAFDSDGLARWSLGTCWSNGGTSLATAPGGEVFVGFVGNDPQDARVQRLTPVGDLDTSFGFNGTSIVETGMGWGSWASVESGLPILRQTDGKIAFAASEQFDWEGGGGFFMVARLLERGGSPGWIGFSRTYAYLGERSGSVDLIVRRTGGSSGPVSVKFEITETGVLGKPNFEASQGMLTWMDGDASNKTITIPIFDDAIWEGSESVNVALYDAAGGAVVITRAASVYIEEDEPAPPSPQVPPTPGQAGSGEIRRGGALGLETLLALGLTLAFARRRRLERRGAR